MSKKVITKGVIIKGFTIESQLDEHESKIDISIILIHRIRF